MSGDLGSLSLHAMSCGENVSLQMRLPDMHRGRVTSLLTHTHNHSCILGRNLEGSESADGHIFEMITFICVAAGFSPLLVHADPLACTRAPNRICH